MEAVGVRCRTLLRVFDPINADRFHPASGHIRVEVPCSGQDMRIVDIRRVIG